MAFSDEDELDCVSELVESMFDKLVKIKYIFEKKKRNPQELDHLADEAVRGFLEVEENKTCAIAEKIIADLLDG